MGSCAKRIHFTNAHPGTGTPSRCERCDEHACTQDEDTSDGLVRRVLFATDGAEDEKPGHLPQRTANEGFPTTEFFDEPQSRESADDVDGTEDDLGDIRVGDTNGPKDSRAYDT